MTHSFKNTSGKEAFGVFLNKQDAGEYIFNKKSKIICCSSKKCTPTSSESNYLLFKRCNRLSNTTCLNSINKANLYINLITKLNLKDVSVIEDFSGNQIPSTIDENVSYPYLRYNIDPRGELFGNNVCGINNYINYLQYNPPTFN
jgi:hypothetical protein